MTEEKSQELRSVSPSSIDTFDDTTPFGCNRKWWFKYPAQKADPPGPAANLGLALAKRNELFLVDGSEPEAGTLKGAWETEQDFKAHALFMRGRPWLMDNLKNTRDLRKPAPWVLGVEMPVPEGYNVGGMKVSRRSASDVVVAKGIIDWKTTSDTKWMKTPAQLRKNTQMLMYADAFHRRLLESGEKVELTHGYYITKGAPAFLPVKTEISIAELDERLAGHIVPLVGEMKKTYLAPTAREVKPNRKICWNCAYRGICPSDKENPLMGIFAKKFGNASGTEAKVTPPDAPPSDPKLAAKPVEGNDVPPAAQEKVRRMLIVDANADGTPVEKKDASTDVTKVETKAEKLRRELAEAEAAEKAEAEAAGKKAAEEAAAAKKAEEAKAESEKKGPGRPPGSKNKATLAKEAREALAESGPVFTKVTATHGVTMNLGIEVGAVRFEVSHTVEYYDGDHAAATKLAMDQAQKDVDAKAEEFMADFRKQQEKAK